MKKRIRLTVSLLVFVLMLGITGCAKSENTKATYDTEMMTEITEVLVQSFVNMGEDQLNQFKETSEFSLNYTLLQSGLPIQSEEFISVIDSWQAAINECGAYESHGEYQTKVTGDGVEVMTEVTYADKKADMTVLFNEKSYVESMTIDAQYGTGEILKKAGLNTLLGMGTVFTVLIFISFIISLFNYIPAIQAKFGKKEAASPAAAPAMASEPEEELSDDLELVAVISAAIAAYEGTSSDGFVVRSIKRKTTNKWN